MWSALVQRDGMAKKPNRLNAGSKARVALTAELKVMERVELGRFGGNPIQNAPATGGNRGNGTGYATANRLLG